MHSSQAVRALLPPLLLLACASGPAAALSDDERRTMLQLHNLYRAQVDPPAANMLRMSWDPELAAFAKAYAERCVWGHNKERQRRGENLFAITERGLDVPLAVQEWHLEHEHYNFSSNACNESQMCGHYTQVIWAKTERIGCGSHFCEKLEGLEESNIHLLVCNYEPPGNVKGQRPYQEGTPCSQCPAGYRCEESLCEPIREPEEAPDFPDQGPEIPSSPAIEDSGSRKTATEEPPSMATEAPPSLATTEGPSSSTTHSAPFLNEVAATSPRSRQVSAPQPTGQEARRTRVTSMSPESSPLPRLSLAGTHELPPHFPAEAGLPPPEEVFPSVSPAQGKPDELPATLDHTRHNASEPLTVSPNTSATAHAEGARSLALQSSLPGEGPERPSVQSGQNSGPGLLWGSPLGQLLLPSLVLARIF
ncbi:peptidase inhibitor 16 isoform X2 [Sorex araneus]|uniref:peptidase inhibitor 16 isoform X2 n=1 Tax=Sorex araneus TaxID=42254 RepID=UPI002433B59A|nr:peptidase inhibitor 16 isoform X2 [Sorex araneus]